MRLAILTGGGDVSPLNALIFSARDEAVKYGCELIGFLNGWQGLLEKRYVSLNNFRDFSQVGGTILKSSRVNLVTEREGVYRAKSTLEELGIDGLIIVGGDDTLSNVYYIDSIPCVLISKTIDNDVGVVNGSRGSFKPENIKNYFTLGYPSAVNRIISYVSLEEGVRTTAFSHERIIIIESMGMHSGWLALSSGLGEPDFIIIPEFPLDYEKFCRKLVDLYMKRKHVIVVIAEGARLSDGKYISANYDEKDDFGHPRFGGSSYVFRDMLKKDLKRFFDTRNINAVNPSYLYRSGRPVPLDYSVAQVMGAKAIEVLVNSSLKEPVFLATSCKDGVIQVEILSLSCFPKTKEGRFPKRYVNTDFYDPDEYQIASIGMEYLKPIVRDSFVYGKLKKGRGGYGFY